MNKRLLPFMAAAVIFAAGCQSKSQPNTSTTNKATAAVTEEGNVPEADTKTPAVDVSKIKVADAKTILARKQVPILCYHQVRNWKPTDGKVGKDYIVEIQNFKDQIKMLADSG